MKVTLKLEKKEYYVLSDAIVKVSGFCYNGINECAGILSFENSRNCSQANTIYTYCSIQDVDKFREFLNDEIAELNRGHSLNVRKYDNLKSILSKLDDAVKEPKCTKCGSLFEDEIFKTDGCEYEDYICSNNKCCAVHTINIQRNEGDWDKEIGEVDIERDWDTLDFEYIWKEGLKKDEPKSDFKKIYCEVCGEGHKSEDIGLVFGLNTCVSCADNIGEELQDRGHNSL